MPDIVTSLITHLRADSGVAAFTDTRIGPSIEAGEELPAIAVVLDHALPVGQALADCTVTLVIQATARADAAALGSYLRSLFGDAYHYLLAASTGDELVVVHSAGVWSHGCGKPADDAPWTVRDQYRFLIPS